MRARHEPVLLAETIRWLGIPDPGLYLDATLGDAGHAEALLDAHPAARLLGCDRDADALAFARERLSRFGDRVMVARAMFRELPEVHGEQGNEPLAGALFDLGLSSRQIDDPERGMSFMADGPLDLRLDPASGVPAWEVVRDTDAASLASVLREHGDVRDAMRLARAMTTAAAAGTLSTTRELAHLIDRSAGGHAHPRRHAQVFQALRIWVNGEAEDLEAALVWLPGVVKPGGVVVTIAYHSGEDRRIKHAVRGNRPVISKRRPAPAPAAAPVWEALHRGVVTPSEEEVARNGRARSARLRAFRRTGS
ncbi:MAG: 16S rRNA (cytosine(1402)-N(4))-methyltransferase RsmH [Candidatus Eisenbacteria bacterium]